MDSADIMCFCHLGKNFVSRVRYTERGSYSFQKLYLNGLREMGLSCPFRYCIIFSVFTVFQKLFISIYIFLISCLHIFSIEPAKFRQIRKQYRECCWLTPAHTMHSRFINLLYYISIKTFTGLIEIRYLLQNIECYENGCSFMEFVSFS